MCGRIGLAELSQMDGSFDIKVDSVAEGFTVFQSMHGIIFYCSSCNVPVGVAKTGPSGLGQFVFCTTEKHAQR